jgi:hypothetical protein
MAAFLRACIHQTRTGVLTAAICVFAWIGLNQAVGQKPAEDATQLCGRAATRAEHEWRLPPGLLAAIGIVESGRHGIAGMSPIIWPWTINAEGRGFYQPSKASAVGMVRALQLRGARLIDVGCFQVDLFYHPFAFATLDEAFDPDANARAAARILGSGRMRSTGWDSAIAAYHSSVPMFGAVYLQRVRAIWPSVAAHRFWADPDTPAEAFAVLLSPQALLVRVITPASQAQPQVIGLPRIIEVDQMRRQDQSGAIVQWLQPPSEALPIVLLPGDARKSPARRTQDAREVIPNTGTTSSR